MFSAGRCEVPGTRQEYEATRITRRSRREPRLSGHKFQTAVLAIDTAAAKAVNHRQGAGVRMMSAGKRTSATTGVAARALDPTVLEREDGRSRIEHEDHLINHRFSWLIGSQSFLLTAFVLLRNDPKFFRGGDPKVPEEFFRRMDLLVYLVIMAGLMYAISSMLRVCAAHLAIGGWRGRVTKDHQYHLTSDARFTSMGGLASFLPGPVFISIWALLLAAEMETLRIESYEFWTPIGVAAMTLVAWILYIFNLFGIKAFVASRRG
jgi:hypothetical protein